MMLLKVKKLNSQQFLAMLEIETKKNLEQASSP